MSLYRVFLRQAAIYYPCVLWNKKKYTHIYSKTNIFRFRITLNIRYKQTLPITFTHHQTR